MFTAVAIVFQHIVTELRRRQNNDYYKNCIKIREAKRTLEFIDSKYDCSDDAQ
jgi:hypothetical protein